jgi:hypothetical protein
MDSPGIPTKETEGGKWSGVESPGVTMANDGKWSGFESPGVPAEDNNEEK